MLRLVSIALGIIVGFATASYAAEPKEHIVKIVSDYDNLRMYFKPKRLTIEPGDTVTWVNEAAEEHNIVSYPDGFPEGAGPLSSPYMRKKDERWSFTFSVKGSYGYHCIPHTPLGMRGLVAVSRPSAEEEFHITSMREMKIYNRLLREFFDEGEFYFQPRKDRTNAQPTPKPHHAKK